MSYNKYGYDITDNQSQTPKHIQSSKAISRLPFKSVFYQHMCISWVCTQPRAWLSSGVFTHAKVSCLLQALGLTLSFMSLAPTQPLTTLAILRLPHDTHAKPNPNTKNLLVRDSFFTFFCNSQNLTLTEFWRKAALGKPLKCPLWLSWSPSVWGTGVPQLLTLSGCTPE